MNNPALSKQDLAKDWLTSLDLRETELRRASSYLVQYLRHTETQSRMLSNIFVSLLAWLTIAPILNHLPHQTDLFIVVAILSCMIWALMLLSAVGVVVLEWRRRLLDREVREHNYPPYAKRELCRIIRRINIFMMLGLRRRLF